MFSKSGRVATWSRTCLKAATIRDTMLYKDCLVRESKPLNEEQETARRQKQRKVQKNRESETGETDSEESEGEEEDLILIKWERE